MRLCRRACAGNPASYAGKDANADPDKGRADRVDELASKFPEGKAESLNLYILPDIVPNIAWTSFGKLDHLRDRENADQEDKQLESPP